MVKLVIIDGSGWVLVEVVANELVFGWWCGSGNLLIIVHVFIIGDWLS